MCSVGWAHGSWCTCSPASSFASDASPQKGKKPRLFEQEELCCHRRGPEMLFRSLVFFPKGLGSVVITYLGRAGQ